MKSYKQKKTVKWKTWKNVTHYFAINVLVIQFCVATKLWNLSKEEGHAGIFFYEWQYFETTFINIYLYSVQYYDGIIDKKSLNPYNLTDDRFTDANFIDLNISKISTVVKLHWCLYTSKFLTSHIWSKEGVGKQLETKC